MQIDIPISDHHGLVWLLPQPLNISSTPGSVVLVTMIVNLYGSCTVGYWWIQVRYACQRNRQWCRENMVSLMIICVENICTVNSVVGTFDHDRICLDNRLTRFFAFDVVVTVVCLLHSASCHENYIARISIDRAIEWTLNESERYWLW